MSQSLWHAIPFTNWGNIRSVRLSLCAVSALLKDLNVTAEVLEVWMFCLRHCRRVLI